MTIVYVIEWSDPLRFEGNGLGLWPIFYTKEDAEAYLSDYLKKKSLADCWTNGFVRATGVYTFSEWAEEFAS